MRAKKLEPNPPSKDPTFDPVCPKMALSGAVAEDVMCEGKSANLHRKYPLISRRETQN